MTATPSTLKRIMGLPRTRRQAARCVCAAVLFWLAWLPNSWAQNSMIGPIYEGFTQPKYEIMVAATEIGQLEAVHVQVGDLVKVGQRIAQLEDTLQQATVKIAKNQSQMHGELDATRAEASMHRNRTAIVRELAATEMARPDELVRAETDLRVAEAREAAAMEQQILRQLELERYELQLSRRQVLAPMAGVISKVFHYPGEYLTPGDPAVVELLVIDELVGVFNVPSEEAVNLRIGNPVAVTLRSASQNIRARLTTISPEIDGESGTVQVRVILDNRERKLLAGDRCTLQLLPADSSPPGEAKQAARSGPTRSLNRGQYE